MAHGAHSLFLGSHTNKIDKKGRIATPAEFRKNLDTDEFNGFVCVPSLSGPYLDCGGLNLLMRFQAMIDEFPPYGEEREDFEIAIMGRARQLGFDTDGRVLLPHPMRHHAGVDLEACFVGRGSYFQIWNAADVEDRFAQAHARARERRFILNNPGAASPLANGQSGGKSDPQGREDTP
ncbi:MAG: division/cell wall cluster transcriptional repressor MraZ [Pseudomonadota bacterium]